MINDNIDKTVLEHLTARDRKMLVDGNDVSATFVGTSADITDDKHNPESININDETEVKKITGCWKENRYGNDLKLKIETDGGFAEANLNEEAGRVVAFMPSIPEHFDGEAALSTDLFRTLIRESAQKGSVMQINILSSADLDQIDSIQENLPKLQYFEFDRNDNTKRTEITRENANDLVLDMEDGYSDYGLYIEINLKELDPDQIGALSTEVTETEKPNYHWKELEQVIGSEEVLNKLRELPEGIRSKSVGLVIRYFIVHRSSEGLDAFLDGIGELDYSHVLDSTTKKEISGLLVKSIADKLGTDVESTKGKSDIFEYYMKNYINNGFCFHAFNGVFEKDISKMGLSNSERQWDWDELKKISAIGKKYGQPMLLGWSDINSSGNTFLSGSPEISFEYGIASPEWFAHFVAEGVHVPNEGDRKKSYYYRDYEMSKKNVLDACDGMTGITVDEKNDILFFFEKYWAKFAGRNSLPKLALVKRSSIFTSNPPATLEEYCGRMNTDPGKVNLLHALDSIGKDGHVDIPFNKSIKSADLVIADLPEYKDIFPRKTEIPK